MNKVFCIVAWTLIGSAAVAGELHVAKEADGAAGHPDVEETAQFSAEDYPEIARRITVEGLERHIRALSNIPSRATGTAGCDSAAEYVMREFRALEVGEPEVQEFPVTVPVSDHVELRSEMGNLPLYPLLPNGICPAALPEGGLETRLEYAGFGRLADVNHKDIARATVVIETGGREQWIHLVDLGARAVIFIERVRPASTLQNATQTGSHQNVPRFWMTRSGAAGLLDRLKQGGMPATLVSDARWEQRVGRNIWVDIPGVSSAAHNKDEIVLISAYYDSSSFVPRLAPGAEQACSIAALLELGRVLKDHPLRKRVRLLATSGHFQTMEGVRRYVWEHVGRHDSPADDVSPQDHAGFFALDLSSNARRVGTFDGGAYFSQNPANLKPHLSYLGERLGRYVSEGAPEKGVNKGIAEVLGWAANTVFVDTINPNTGKGRLNCLPSPMPLEHEAALLAGIPSLAFVTTNDSRFYAGTPNDTDVNLSNLAIQTKLLACLIPNALNVEGQYIADSLPRSICRVRGQAVESDLRGNRPPSAPIPYCMVTGRRSADRAGFQGGVATRLLTTADAEGRFEFVGLGTGLELPPSRSDIVFEPYVVKGGQITYAPDFGRRGRLRHPLKLRPIQKTAELICGAFPCRTLELYNLFDPRTCNPLAILDVRDAESNVVPNVYGSTIAEPRWSSYSAPTATVFAQPGARLTITCRAEANQNRLMMWNVVEELDEANRRDTGEGFNVDDTPAIRLAYLQGARDMWRLSESRITLLQSHGLDDARINGLHDEAGESLKKAEEALKWSLYQEYGTQARRALGLESQVHADLARVTRDALRGLIFCLAALLLLALTVERLFLAARRVWIRIAAVVFLFGAMFLALWLMHPAPHIIMSPMTAFIVFAASAPPIAVICVLFDTLGQLVSWSQIEESAAHGSEGHAVSRFALVIRAGIATARRGKASMTLTSIALVAVTFTVLSFASVSSRIRAQQHHYREGATPYRGFLLRNKDWEPFPFETYAALKNELGDACVLAPRRWYYGHPSRKQSAVDVQLGQQILPLRALAGLTAQETELMDIEAALLGDSRWLSEDVAGEEAKMEILVPVSLARAFAGDETDGGSLSRQEKVRVANGFLGKRVQLLGRRFSVVGVFDADAMDQLVDIDGESLAPSDPVASEKTYQQEGARDPEAVRHCIHHSFADVGIVPERVLGALGGDLRSLAVMPRWPGDLELITKGLVTRMDYALYVNLNGTPTLMSGANGTRVPEPWSLALFAAIAGLIVFNTMLGAARGRVKEIGAFNPLGIAPSRIRRMFMVGAAAHGIIGVALGYLLGQMASWAVRAYDVPVPVSLDLNYSSLYGVGACVFVTLVILASAYCPVREVGRIKLTHTNSD